MKRSSGPRKTANLSESVQKQLSMYALAASAAGVGVLACSLPAEGEIVFTSVFVQIPPKAMVNLDLNGDGIADFQFSNTAYVTSRSVFRGKMKVLPLNQGNAIWGAVTSASALGPGVVVGSKGKFQPGHEFMATAGYYCNSTGCHYGSRGPWKEASRAYLGLRFTIQGQPHFGWARLNLAATAKGVYAAVTGYAYETVPNKSIVTGQTKGAAKKNNVGGVSHPRSLNPSTPEPASLGLLARGSLGLDAWRRRDAACL